MIKIKKIKSVYSLGEVKYDREIEFEDFTLQNTNEIQNFLDMNIFMESEKED